TQLRGPCCALAAGAPFGPAAADAGAWMAESGFVAPPTGNISVGTSIFGMVVLEDELKKRHDELDIVTTPAGDQVAMVHCNNGASEIGAWADVFHEFANQLQSATTDISQIYEILFQSALQAEPDAGGVVSYNYLS